MFDGNRKLNIVDRIRANLQPKGTASVVKLQLANYGMFDSNFINRCINEIERMNIRIALGDKPTELERLAIHLLMDSAYIDLENEREFIEENQQNAQKL